MAAAIGLPNLAHFLGAVGAYPAARASAERAPSNAPVRRYDIPHAAGLYVTDRGQRRIEADFLDILRRNDIDLGSQLWPRLTHQTEVISLANLPAALADQGPMLRQVRDAIQEWATGFRLRDPQVLIELTNAGYRTEGLRLGVRSDADLTRKLRGPGVAFYLTASIPSIRVSADKVVARDLRNPILGSFGVEKPGIQLAQGDSLYLEVPFRLTADSRGGLEFKTLPGYIGTNARKLRFASDARKRWLLPQVQLEINGHASALDARPLKEVLDRKEAELVKVLQYHLERFIHQELPGHLDAKAFSLLQMKFEAVKEIVPPGSGGVAPSVPMSWGFRLAQLGLTKRHLALDLEGYVDDPGTPWGSDPAIAPAAKLPYVAGMDLDRYDAALAINQNMINHMLRLSFERGALSKVDLGEGQSARLMRAPVFSAGDNGRGRLRIVLEQATRGIAQAIGLKDPYQIQLDAIVGVRVPPRGNGFELVIERLDESTARIEDRFLALAQPAPRPPGLETRQASLIPDLGFSPAKRLRQAVNDGIRSELRARNAGMARKPRALTDSPIELPTEIYGLRYRVIQAEYDPKGYVVLYLNLEPESSR